jgi:hypothetical protein
MRQDLDPYVGYGAFGLSTLVSAIFAVLKLTHVVAWSWLWIFSPYWLPVVLFFGVACLLLFIAAICASVR